MILFSVFLGFSSWKNSCSAQQMLFHCEYMKLIGELLTMWTMWTIRTVKCEDRLHIYRCYCWLWFRLYCFRLSLMPSGLGKNTTQLTKYPHVLYFVIKQGVSSQSKSSQSNLPSSISAMSLTVQRMNYKRVISKK